jgi:hypothetical protein
MNTSDKEKSFHDYLQEFSRHIRSVYYLILIGAAAILLATSVETERSIERALDQLDALIQLRDTWDERWLDTLAEENLESAAATYAAWPAELPRVVDITVTPDSSTGIPPIAFAARRHERHWTFRGEGGYAPPNTANPASIPGIFAAVLTIPASNTVDDVRVLWDSLQVDPRFNLLTMPEDPVAIMHSGFGSATTVAAVNVQIREAQSEDPMLPAIHLSQSTDAAVRLLSDGFTVPLLPRGSMHTAFEQATGTITHSWQITVDADGRFANLTLPPSVRGSGFRIEIPLHAHRMPVPAQETLRDLLNIQIPLGRFDFSFAELSEHSAGLEELPIAKLREFLNKRANQVKRDVDLFGLTFQGSALGSWGLVLLATVQFYFLVLFRKFYSLRLDHSWDFPWLALHSDRLSMTLFAVSAFVFPTAVVTMLAGYHFADGLQWPLSAVVVLGLTVSILAAGWGLFLYGSLQRKCPHT